MLRHADRLDGVRFSAGGPVVWPEVEALLLVPISAHALFTRPLVTAPTLVGLPSRSLPYTTLAVLCCDGRRVSTLPPGARVEVSARRDAGAAGPARARTPFTDRLVAKFGLPVDGWRGSRRDGAARTT